MARYWVIAPVESKNPQLFNQVCKFDLANNLISIGWNELGDISKVSREDLSAAVTKAFPDRKKGLISNMLWAFYHDIGLGDIVIARRGRKVIAAVGKVVCTGFYEVGRNPFLKPPGYAHSNFLGVEWLAQPKDKLFSTIVFPMQTVSEISEDRYHSLVDDVPPPPPGDPPPDVTDQSAFVLEKYLEDFIVTNFTTIFKGKLNIYEDADGNDGQQYDTEEIGIIDILAFEPESNSFVVIELKKGRPPDQVVGQILRYMGWVKKNLCRENQSIKGLVICKDSDERLSYALAMTPNIAIQYYTVSFALRERSE